MPNRVCSPQLPVEMIVERIFETRRLTRADQQVFMSALLSKESLTPAEQIQIDRVFEGLRQGRIRVVE